jgi:hypothetical protein
MITSASAIAEADDPISAPQKGLGPGSQSPEPFPLQNSHFLGTAERGHHRHLGPPGKPTVGILGEGHAPFVAVLSGRQTSHTSIIVLPIWGSGE